METQALQYDILNCLPNGVIVADERGVIVFANTTFTEMIGYESEMLLGLNLLSLLADVNLFFACIDQVMREGVSFDTDTDFIHRDNSIVHTVKSVRMIRQNVAVRLFINLRNLTEADRLHKELRDSYELIEYQAQELSSLLNSKNQELEEILCSIDEVIWYIDNTTLSLRYVNNAVENIFGYSKERFLTDTTLWQQRIHPDDRALVRTFFETLAPGSSQEIRFRIFRANDQLRWISSRIHHHPRLYLFVGVTRDITEIRA